MILDVLLIALIAIVWVWVVGMAMIEDWNKLTLAQKIKSVISDEISDEGQRSL